MLFISYHTVFTSELDRLLYLMLWISK